VFLGGEKKRKNTNVFFQLVKCILSENISTSLLSNQQIKKRDFLKKIYCLLKVGTCCKTLVIFFKFKFSKFGPFLKTKNPLYSV
jgi:hypothetical protein